MRGFTLLETVITTAVLVTGLVAVSAAFAYTARTNITTQQRTAATMLLYEKIEQSKSTPLTDARWNPGGGLDPASPITGYFDTVTVEESGVTYVRLWQVADILPRTMTVVVYAKGGGVVARPLELARATATMSPKF